MSFYNFCNLENVLAIQKIKQSEVLLRKEYRKGGRKGGWEGREGVREREGGRGSCHPDPGQSRVIR